MKMSPRTHLQLFHAYRCGTISRSGQPWSGSRSTPLRRKANRLSARSRSASGQVRRVAVPRLADVAQDHDVGGLGAWADALQDLAHRDPLPAVVERAPAGHAVEVRHDLGVGQCHERVVAQGQRLLDEAAGAEVPGRGSKRRHAAGVEDGPLEGQRPARAAGAPRPSSSSPGRSGRPPRAGTSAAGTRRPPRRRIASGARPIPAERDVFVEPCALDRRLRGRRRPRGRQGGVLAHTP